MSNPLALGEVVVTPTVNELLARCGQTIDALLERHRSGDWGDVSDEQRQINEQAADHAYCVVSTYNTGEGASVMVFTKADRSCTMVHLAPQVAAASSTVVRTQR